MEIWRNQGERFREFKTLPNKKKNLELHKIYKTGSSFSAPPGLGVIYIIRSFFPFGGLKIIKFDCVVLIVSLPDVCYRYI